MNTDVPGSFHARFTAPTPDFLGRKASVRVKFMRSTGTASADYEVFQEPNGNAVLRLNLASAEAIVERLEAFVAQVRATPKTIRVGNADSALEQIYATLECGVVLFYYSPTAGLSYAHKTKQDQKSPLPDGHVKGFVEFMRALVKIAHEADAQIP